MEFNPLLSISSIDGRYRAQTEFLSPFFSEFALIKYRVFVEIKYFIELQKTDINPLKNFSNHFNGILLDLFQNFNLEDAKSIKNIEKTTNHDVKAVEYWLKNKFVALNLSEWKEFIHFGLTSQDINNVAIPLATQNALTDVIIPKLMFLVSEIKKIGIANINQPMLARTHGQPASPTFLGKEILVFVERLEKQILVLNNISLSAKFGGAVGNFNAHHFAFPDINWNAFADEFISNLGLERSQLTTQIDHYDKFAELFHAFERINTILIDFCRDIWTYISMEYFTQSVVKNEVGSSAMPHKVNPIDFENAEGNLAIANANFSFLANKLPVSRLQRDLTDSTVLRNLGVPFSHSLIAYNSITKGLLKLSVNERKLNQDLNENWAVISEGIQTLLRANGIENPYELLKELTRSENKLSKEKLIQFVSELNVSEDIKSKILELSPINYTGILPDEFN